MTQMRLAECYFHPSGGGSIVIDDSNSRADLSGSLKDIIDSSTMYRAESLLVRTPGGWHALSLLPVACLVTILLGATCILPGVRHWRLTRAGSLLWTVATGFSVVCALQQPGWTSIDGWLNLPLAHTLPYSQHVELILFCGLQGIDVTLYGVDDGEHGGGGGTHHWHMFSWPELADSLGGISRSALYSGLPWPMITALDNVLSQAGPELRRAGYISSWLLSAGGYSWLVGVWLLLIERAAVKPLTARVVLMTGALLVSAAAAYVTHLPSMPVHVRFDDGHQLSLQLAWCFWLVVASGSANVTVGAWLILGEYMNSSDAKKYGFRAASSGVTSPAAQGAAYEAGGPVLSVCWPRRSSKLTCHKSLRVDSVSMNIPLNNLGQSREDPSATISGSQSSGTVRLRHNSSPWKTPGSMPRRCVSSSYAVTKSMAPLSSGTSSDVATSQSETTGCAMEAGKNSSSASLARPQRPDSETCLDSSNGSGRRGNRVSRCSAGGYSTTMFELSNGSSEDDD